VHSTFFIKKKKELQIRNFRRTPKVERNKRTTQTTETQHRMRDKQRWAQPRTQTETNAVTNRQTRAKKSTRGDPT
jgi:hypothetical protein